MDDNDKKRTIDISSENDHVKEAFLAIKDELDEHRESINDASGEIEQNYEFLFDIEKKLSKMEEKVDELMFFMKEISAQRNMSEPMYLSKIEQKIFIKLYTTEKTSLSCAQIAEELRTSEVVVKACISSLIKRNIPIFTERINCDLVYKLDPHFRQMQAKRGIVKLDQTLIAEWV